MTCWLAFRALALSDGIGVVANAIERRALRHIEQQTLKAIRCSYSPSGSNGRGPQLPRCPRPTSHRKASA